jgi:hypothetical protein
MGFSTLSLTGERIVVKGTDIEGGVGETILDASQWNELKARKTFDSATDAFNEAVEAFFAPLMEAADKIGKTLEKPEDSLGFVVLDEGVEATPGRAPHVVKLTKDSMILRLLEDGNTDRLVWVGDSLEILEVLPGTGTGVVASGAEVIGEENMPATGISPED